MKEKLLLVGAGGFGRVVSEHARKLYDCYFVDDAFEHGDEVCDILVAGKISDLKQLRSVYSRLVVTIGNNKLRQRLYEEAIKIGFTFPSIVCSSAYISPYSSIGYGCVILNNAIIQNNVQIGNGVIINPGVEIHHDSIVDDYALIYTNSVVRTYSRIGRGAWIGSTLTISNNVSIPEGAIVEDGRSVTF